VTADRKTFLELADGGYVARKGADVLLHCGAGHLEIRIAGPVLEAMLRACLEAKGVEVLKSEGSGGGDD
jgi:hypothetical protein